MNTGIENYNFDEKNKWRIWNWNRIRERLTCKPRDALVLYLAGPQDLDRAVAMRKGFDPLNMIAVEN